MMTSWIPVRVCTRSECSSVYPMGRLYCPYCGAPSPQLAVFPWNDEHPCFTGDFDSIDPFDHDFKYEDTSRGDGLYFQQSGHMECRNCGQCESADGWYGSDY